MYRDARRISNLRILHESIDLIRPRNSILGSSLHYCKGASRTCSSDRTCDVPIPITLLLTHVLSCVSAGESITVRVSAQACTRARMIQLR
jgi:hypothetical protein